MQFLGCLLSQKITFGPIWVGTQKEGPNWTPMVPKGPTLGLQGPPWAGAHMGPWGPKGTNKTFFSLKGGPHLGLYKKCCKNP